MTIFGVDTTFANLQYWYLPCSSHRIDIADYQRKIEQEFAFIKTPNKETTEAHWERDPQIDNTTSAARNLHICMIGAAPFNTFVRQPRKARDIKIFSILMRDIEIALQTKKLTNPTIKLTAKYHDYFDVFSKADSDLLPEHQPYNHSIPLMKGKMPMWSPLYFMSANKLKILKAYIEKMIDKCFIWTSFSLAASPVLFAKKPGGSLRFCVDYRQLNVMTIKNC